MAHRWLASTPWPAEDGGPARTQRVEGRPGPRAGRARLAASRDAAIAVMALLGPDRGLVLGYDSANGVMAAFDLATLDVRWRRDLATSQHLWLYPDSGEVVANDHDRAAGDSLVVVDITTGEVRAKAAVGSPAQSVVFGSPGWERDAYFVSLSTIARVVFAD